MLIKHLMRSIITACTSPLGHGILLTIYYLAIIIGLLVMYGKGNFAIPKFIYQGF